jgi:GTPase SAR1 family protein
MSEETPLRRLTAATQAVAVAYDCLEKCARASEQPNLARDIDHDRQRISGGLRVAVVGAFSSGKSTFVNALIGRKVLPTKVEPTTATVTEVRNGPGRTASVHLKSETDIKQELEQALERHKALSELSEREPHEEEELRSLDTAIQLNPKFEYPNGVPQFFSLDRDQKIVDRFLAEGKESWAPYTEKVTIEVPMDEEIVPAGAAILDTPGSNSLSRLHRNATWKALIEADCVIFLMTARAPLSAHDRELVLEISRVRKRQGLAHDRFLFVANGIDDVEEDERAGVEAYLTERLQEGGINQPRVCLASALVAWLARSYAAGETLSKRERRLLMDMSDDQPERGWEGSGVKAVMDMLWSTVGREAAVNLYGDALGRARARFAYLQAEVADQLEKAKDSEDKAKGAAREAERFLAGKRKQTAHIEREGRAIASSHLRNLDDVESLRRSLTTIVDGKAKEANLPALLEGEVRHWLEGRLAEVEQRVAASGSEIQTQIGRSLDEQSASAYALPEVPRPTFDLRFDLPGLIDPRGEGVAAPTSFGALLGGVIGGFLGGPGGAALGASLGGLLFRSAAAKKLKDKWNELLQSRKKEVDQHTRRLQPALAEYLKHVENLLVQWGLDHFEGRLNDIQARYDLRVRLAQEAAVDAYGVRARLQSQLQALSHCESLLVDADQKVDRLKK